LGVEAGAGSFVSPFHPVLVVAVVDRVQAHLAQVALGTAMSIIDSMLSPSRRGIRPVAASCPRRCRPAAFARPHPSGRLDRLAERIDAGDKDFGLEASIAKMRASDIANRIAAEAVQMHGGYGYCSDFRAERLMRDAKITQIWEGTTQVHRQLIGRSFAAK
jgi:alkylation response protein AidB-like acyl-CoA dehydrogenase